MASAAPPRICCLLSSNGHDPTEIAVPCSILAAAGYVVEFATEDGKPAACDPRMISGAVGALLGATSEAKALYAELIKTPAWAAPHSWAAPTFSLLPYAGVLLPGGHDKPMRQYLESTSLQKHLVEYFPLTKGGGKVVGAICHGVLALARAKDADGKSVLSETETSTLPVFMEKSIYFATAPFLGGYYRTYPEYTADEVQSLLARPTLYKSGGLFNMKPFVHVDPHRSYVSARFPGDAELFGDTMVALLKKEQQ